MTPFTAQNAGRFARGRARSPGGVNVPDVTGSADVIVVSASFTCVSAEQSVAALAGTATSATPAANRTSGANRLMNVLLVSLRQFDRPFYGEMAWLQFVTSSIC